jgi:hypothetical protein
MARLGVQVGRWVRKLRAVGDQADHPPGKRETSELGGNIIDSVVQLLSFNN